MYFSKSFIPILKNNPTEAKIKSHQLMLRVGMIKQSSAGIYSWLPLGFKVMKKIEQIVREEQDRVGVQEILMPTIQSSDIWKESGHFPSRYLMIELLALIFLVHQPYLVLLSQFVQFFSSL